MSLPPEREAELLELATNVAHAWRVAGNRSFAHSSEWDIYFNVLREQGLSDFMPAELALGWIKTGNPHYVDLAIYRAAALGIERGETLEKMLVQVAAKRTNAATKAGGPFRIRRAIAKELGFTMICLFHLCADAPLAQASSKAAQWLVGFDPGFGCKASVLELEYPRSWRCPLSAPHEFSEPTTKEQFAAQVLSERFDSIPNPAGHPTIYQSWAATYEALPFADPYILGERR